ncbi:hypothetical protein BKA61DRAFT_607066 [Leptodontidium sp. MPI-SDFR-AT-0119]|nr:hypothetical protein BKA61DRAFT_607066 [Leptodontidium sp. MPI-SDFR-AT-0119]
MTFSPMIDRAHTAQLAIDSHFDWNDGGSDEFFAWMKDSNDTTAAVGGDLGRSVGGDVVDDTFSWVLDQYAWNIDATGSGDEDLWTSASEAEDSGNWMGPRNPPSSTVFTDDAARQESAPELVGDLTISPGASSPDGTPVHTPSASETSEILYVNAEILPTTAMGRVTPTTDLDSPEDQPSIKVPDHVRRIVGSDILDDDSGSEYCSQAMDSPQRRRFDRASRRKGRLNQMRDTHIGVMAKVLDRLINQVQTRDNGKDGDDRTDKDDSDDGDDSDESDDDGEEIYLLSEVDVTCTTLGVLHWLASDVQRYQAKLRRALQQRKDLKRA